MLDRLAVRRSCRACRRWTIRSASILRIAKRLTFDDVAVIVDVGMLKPRRRDRRIFPYVTVVSGRMNVKDRHGVSDLVVRCDVKTVVSAKEILAALPNHGGAASAGVALPSELKAPR